MIPTVISSKHSQHHLAIIHIITALIILVLSVTNLSNNSILSAKAANKADTYHIFSLPFTMPPGPQTWLFGQPFGNTYSAFNLGRYWYGAGEGLHFGLDFAAACGTPVSAIGDGVVQYVDNFVFGLLPHNVVILHSDSGYVSMYGHLLTKSTLTKGQAVKRGDVIGFSGDPDLTCMSRPHLHLEIRSRDHLHSFDPVPFIDADWSMLSSIGYYSFSGFAKNLYNPREWQTLEDQPTVKFKGPVLNNFEATWPPLARVQPPPTTLPPLFLPPVPSNKKFTFTQLSDPGCCSQAWFTYDSKHVEYIDGEPDHLAHIMDIDLSSEISKKTNQVTAPKVMDDAPPALWSNNGQYRLKWNDGKVTLERPADSASWSLATGAWPGFSPNTIWMMWQYLPSDAIPGSTVPMSEIWVARPDGRDLSMILRQPGGSAYWLDDERILLLTRKDNTNVIEMKVYNASSKTVSDIIEVPNLRRVSIAPGGQHLIYYAPFQEHPETSGVYLLDPVPGTKPILLPFFGSWRWRDSNTLIYIPFAQGKPMSFMVYNIITGQSYPLDTPPFAIANDDWSISPDGRYLMMWQNSTSTEQPYLTLIDLRGPETLD